MNAKYLIAVAIILTTFNLVLAQNLNILQIDLDIYQDDRVVVNEIKLTFGKPSQIPSKAGAYSLRIIDESNNILYRRDFPGNFFIFDVNKVQDKFTIFEKIEYNPSMQKVQLYKNNKLIFSADLSNYIKQEIPEQPKQFDFLILAIIIILVLIFVIVILLFKKHQSSSNQRLSDIWKKY